MPIPRLDSLPGVMTAMARHTVMLKTGDLVPYGRAVLAGQGPLLYLAALQLARAGAPPTAILETAPHRNYHAATGHLGAALGGWRALAKGLAMIAGLRRAGIPILRGVSGLRAIGSRRIEQVAWNGGQLAADLLLLHEGVIPNTQISLALGLDHRWDDAQQCWRPVADEWGATTLPTIAIAGDGGGIVGAAAAAQSGRLAALDAASFLDKIDPAAARPARARPLRAALRRARAIRPTFLDALYRPAPSGAGAGRRRHRLPLRRGDGGPSAPCRPAWRARPEPGQGLHPLRHGALPRPHLRADRQRRDGRYPQEANRGNRRLPPPRAL